MHWVVESTLQKFLKISRKSLKCLKLFSLRLQNSPALHHEEPQCLSTLKRSIEEFKNKYIEEDKAKDPTSGEMIESLMNIQRDAVEVGIKDISELDKLTDLIYGKAVEPVKQNGHDRTQEVNQDVLNRTLRELEATENLAVHFKTELEKLKEDLEKSKQETEAYERVSESYDNML
jgi:hypothetical protein